MLVRRPSSVVPALLILAALSGCAGNGPQLPSLGVQTVSDAPSTVGVAPSPANPSGEEATAGIPISGAVGSATDIYSHIASGAMACWFAAHGPLKKDYIFHAAAEPASRGGGGKAVITIHERDPSQPNPRGFKAYVVEIQPTGESSANVRADNRKMPEAYAAAMTGDISRWAKGEEGCKGPSTAAAWPPIPGEVAAATPTAAKKSKKPKAKAKTTPAQTKAATPAPAKPATSTQAQP
jgi:hypothetical protein